MKLDWIDYSLVLGGIVLLFAYGLGLILIGIAVYRIGHKMEKVEEKPWKKDFDDAMKQFEKDMEKIDEDVGAIEVALSPDKPDLIDRKRFKLKSYSSKTLEDGK